MSHEEKKSASPKPEKRVGSLRPARRDSQLALHNTARHETTRQLVSEPERLVRHDGRSALHSIVGYVDLLESGALGGLTAEQQLALAHVKTSALWLYELLDSSLDMAQGNAPIQVETTPICLVQVASSTITTLSRDQPNLRITFSERPVDRRLLVSIEANTLRQIVSALVTIMSEQTERELWAWITHTDLHVCLTLSSPREEVSGAQSMPARELTFAELSGVPSNASSRSAIRLKRCDALLTRHHGRLLLTPDLSCLRMLLPLQGLSKAAP